MTPVFQSALPFDPTPRKLPGIQPTSLQDWLHVDDAYAGQMAQRDHLLAQRPEAVLAMHPDAREAAEELLDLVLDLAFPQASGPNVIRPDGAQVTIDRAAPMATLGRLVQEDLIILQKVGDEHVLTAAALCFPASWTLSEKFMKPLTRIHVPVPSYDDSLARRVQRLFDGVQPDRPLWRFNALWYDTPDLHLPKTETVHQAEAPRSSGAYLRSERQCILRLPVTKATVFSVHTYLIPAADLSQETLAQLDGQQ